METNPAEVAQLIRETARAHHAYQEEVFGGEYQPNWHPWYAEHLLAHGLPEHLPAPLSQERLAELLVQFDREYTQGQPDMKWPDYYAERLLEILGA